MNTSAASLLHQHCQVFLADHFRVEVGAFIGDPLSTPDHVNQGDLFALARSATPGELILTTDTPRRVSSASSVGTPGEAVQILARHTVMGDRGSTVEVLVLQVGPEQMILPLGALVRGDEYTLLSSETVQDADVLANVTSVSFTRGTHVTMGNGMQVRVEDLQVGDKLLTRDHGPQPIRWIGRQTVRAEGQRAPVVITKGALNNAGDLVLSPDHRLFIYQRHDAIGAGRAEVLVRARNLVNDETIFVREGGHVDYFHLLFDHHEIIYVEGIQAESLLVSPDVIAGFDEDLASDLTRTAGALNQTPTRGAEPSARDLQGLDAAELLKRASSR